MRRPALTIPVLMASWALGAPTARAQQGFEHALPENTLLLLGVDDMDGLRAGLGDTAWSRFLEDPQVREETAALRDLLAQWSDLLVEELGLDPTGLPGLVTGPAALAVIDLSDTPLSEVSRVSPEGAPRPPVAVGLLLDLGDQREEAEPLLDLLLERWSEQEELVIGTADVDGEAVTTVSPDREDGPVPWIQFGFQGRVLVAAMGGPETEDAFLYFWDAAAGASERVLAEGPAFQDVLGSWDGVGPVFYLDVGGCVALARGVIEAVAALPRDQPAAGPDLLEVVAWLERLHLGPMAQTVGLGPDGTDGSFRWSWGPEGPVAAVADAFIVNTLPELLQLMPADVRVAMAGRVDFPAGFDAVLGEIIAAGADPADLAAGLAGLTGTLGFELRDDLLVNLDGQVGLFVKEVGPAERIPGVDDDLNYALILGLEDGEALRTLVDGLLDDSAFRASVKREDFQGFEVARFALGIPPGAYLHFCITDDLAAVSLAPSMVLDVLRRKLGGSLPSAATYDGVAEGLGRHDARHAFVSFGVAARDVNDQLLALQSVATLLPGGWSDELPPPLRLLPDVLEELAALGPFDQALLERYFGKPSLSTAGADGSGLWGRSTGP